MRKKKSKKKLYFPDPKFNDSLVTRFINHLMKNGKKTVAYKIFYEAMKKIDEKKEDKNKSCIAIWKEALIKIMPQIEIKSRRIGGSIYHIPIQINYDKKMYLAIKWLIFYSRKRNEKTMGKKLAYEILSAFKGNGESIKKKQEIHKMADSNKAYSHFKI